jgi:hypothetical protein
MNIKRKSRAPISLMGILSLTLLVCPMNIRLMDSASAVQQPPIVINELLARVPTDDPATTNVIEGDANGDGVREANLDEFVELVNVGIDPFNLSGYEVDDTNSAGNLKFPNGTIVPAGEAVVIFGGGDLMMSKLEFGNARALGLVFTVGGSGGFGFGNAGDAAIVRDPRGQEVARLDYDSMNPVPQPIFQSLNRNPEITGPFVNHRDVMGAGQRAFSPGTRVDGSAFRRVLREALPNAGPMAGGNQVTLNGAGFGSAIESVWFGSQAATDVMRINSLQVVVRAPAITTTGPVVVKVIDQFGEIVGQGIYTYQ